MNRKTTRVILLVGLVIMCLGARPVLGQLAEEEVAAEEAYEQEEAFEQEELPERPGASEPQEAFEQPEASEPRDSGRQPAGATAPTPAPAREGGTFHRTEPRIIFLEDEEKNLVPIVDLSLREFDWMYQLAHRLAQPPETPRFVLTGLKLKARAETDRAHIDARISVRTLVDGWQLIPLHMGRAQLVEQPEVVSDKTQVLARFNQQTEGYELWLRGEEGGHYEVDVPLICSVRQMGAESQLRLSLPRTATSEMQLTLPGEDLVVSTSDTMVMTSQESRDGHTHVRLQGLVADFQLTWRSPRATSVNSDPLFEVDGEIDVQVDSRGIVTSYVRLNLTAYDQAIRRFTVRMPATSRLLTSEDSGYTMQIGTAEGGVRELEIEFEEPEFEPVVVLNVQVDKNAEGAYDLASYEVLGALRQSGVVSLVSQGDWRLSWNLDRFARRISEPDTSRRVKAVFEYFQPDQIELALLREQTHLTVEPFYRVEFQESEALLTAVYRYRTRGAKASSVKIDLGRWELTHVGPIENVRVHEVYPLLQPNEMGPDGGNGLLEIPLTTSVPNEFEIQLEARLVFREPLAKRPRPISLLVPPPHTGDLLLQSTVVVDSASNVIVMRDTPETSEAGETDAAEERARLPAQAGLGEFEKSWTDEALSLAALPDAIAEQLNDVAKAPLCFHMRDVGSPPPLRLLASTLERTTTVRCETEITEIRQNAVRVRQRFLWKISNVQLPRATLLVTNDVYQRGDLQVTVEGKRVAVVMGPPSFAMITNQRTPVSVPLPSPALGNFEMVAEYQVPLEETDVSPQKIDLPLILPRLEPSVSRPPAFLDTLQGFDYGTGSAPNGGREPETFAHRFLRSRIPGYRIGLGESLWTSATQVTVSGQTPSSLLATTDQLLGEIPIELQRVDTKNELVVDRAWFQTWYTHSTRQDRAVFRILGRVPKASEKTQPTLRIWLPPRFHGKQMFLIVDGQRREDVVVEEGIAEVDILDPTRAVHVIEVICSSESRDPPGKLTMEAPRIEGANMLGQWFWHLVVPRSECLLSSPGHLTPAYRWSWSHWLPKSDTQMSQAELEDWIEAARTQKTVLWGSSEYLFGALGPVENLTVRTTTMPLFVLLCSGTVLVIGVVLIYTQHPQRLYLLFPVVVLLLVLMVVNPALGALAGQAAVIGFLSVLLAMFLSWLFRQAGRHTILRAGSASTISVGTPRSSEARTLAAVEATALTPGSSQHSTIEPTGI